MNGGGAPTSAQGDADPDLPAYSLPIVLELEERTGRAASPSKVYMTLRRLEERGLLRSRFVPPPTEGGRARRCFALEPAGLEALREAKRTLEVMWQDLPVLGGR